MKFIWALLLTAFFIFPVQSKIIVKDKFLFKLAGEVFTLSEVKSYFQSARALGCTFQDSLVNKVFAALLKEENQNYFNVTKQYSSSQKNYFKSLVKFGKVLVYIRSYNIEIKKEVLKYFSLQSEVRGCQHVFTNMNSEKVKGRTFSRHFQEVVKLEVFLRARFLPTEIQGKTTAEDMQKAIISTKNLLNSISDQLDEEVYW